MRLKSKRLADEIATLEKTLSAARATRAKVAEAELLKLAHRANAVDDGIAFFQDLLERRSRARASSDRARSGADADT